MAYKTNNILKRVGFNQGWNDISIHNNNSISSTYLISYKEKQIIKYYLKFLNIDVMSISSDITTNSLIERLTILIKRKTFPSGFKNTRTFGLKSTLHSKKNYLIKNVKKNTVVFKPMYAQAFSKTTLVSPKFPLYKKNATVLSKLFFINNLFFKNAKGEFAKYRGIKSFRGNRKIMGIKRTSTRISKVYSSSKSGKINKLRRVSKIFPKQVKRIVQGMAKGRSTSNSKKILKNLNFFFVNLYLPLHIKMKDKQVYYNLILKRQNNYLIFLKKLRSNKLNRSKIFLKKAANFNYFDLKKVSVWQSKNITNFNVALQFFIQQWFLQNFKKNIIVKVYSYRQFSKTKHWLEEIKMRLNASKTDLNLNAVKDWIFEFVDLSRNYAYSNLIEILRYQLEKSKSNQQVTITTFFELLKFFIPKSTVAFKLEVRGRLNSSARTTKFVSKMREVRVQQYNKMVTFTTAQSRAKIGTFGLMFCVETQDRTFLFTEIEKINVRQI